jgi:hypothetical protein
MDYIAEAISRRNPDHSQIVEARRRNSEQSERILLSHLFSKTRVGVS